VPATLRDVAQRAGVSTTTVSHVLNGTRFVAPETAERVRLAALELGYAANSVARGLRTGSSRTIGVVGPSALDEFFAAVLVGVEEACYRAGYELYIGYVEYPCGEIHDGSAEAKAVENEFHERVLAGDWRAPCPPCPPGIFEKEAGLIAKLAAREIDGLVIHPGQSDEAAAATLAGIGAELALMHRSVAGVDADVFAADDYAGFRAAMDDLVAKGHRRIAMVDGFSWPGHQVRERYRAYVDALAAAGIAPDRDLVANGGYDMDTAARATSALLARPDRPTAIAYWSDTMAVAGMDAARRAGLSVPEDLSVVGFDDLRLASMTRPRLSSVNQSSYEMGFGMARRLIDRIEGRLSGPGELVLSPTTYVPRESVGPNPRS
jgi:LacI family transcriptional regulator